MRNLTIKRAKRFVACAARMKVYIEDTDTNDLTIHGTTCRFLGAIKNGGEATFAVSEEGARVYVIADKISRDYCNDYFTLPAGTEDVVLTGRNVLNPAAGNPFRFDGAVDADRARSHAKGRNKGMVVLIAAIVIGMVLGVGGYQLVSGLLSGSGKPQEFTAENFQIILTSKFSETTVPNYTVAFESRDVVVLGLQESKLLFEGFGVDSLTDYSKAVQQANGHDYPIQKGDGFLYYEYQYTAPDTGDTYHYYTMMYKGAFNFWIVQFATPQEKAETYRQTVMDWAKTVKVN